MWYPWLWFPLCPDSTVHRYCVALAVWSWNLHIDQDPSLLIIWESDLYGHRMAARHKENDIKSTVCRSRTGATSDIHRLQAVYSNLAYLPPKPGQAPAAFTLPSAYTSSALTILSSASLTSFIWAITTKNIWSNSAWCNSAKWLFLRRKSKDLSLLQGLGPRSVRIT